MVIEAESRLDEIRLISASAFGSNPGKQSTEYIETLRNSADELFGKLPESAEELEEAQRLYAEQAEAEAAAWWDHLKRQSEETNGAVTEDGI